MQPRTVLTAIVLTTGLLLAQQTKPLASSPDQGVDNNSIYSFSCMIPVGWVLRTDEMNVGNDAAKSQPGWVREVCNRWLEESEKESTKRICMRAMRSIR